MSEDIKKGLLGIVVDETEVSKVMPEINSLTYRGYAAQDLCEYCRFEEVAYLILNKDLPNSIQLKKFEKEERNQRELSKNLYEIIKHMPKKSHPMDVARTAVSVMGLEDKETSTLINGVKEFLIWCKEQNISMAVCTNKQEHLSNDLLKKIGIYDFFEYVAGSDTFDYCKPDPRHLTNVVEILDGDVKKTIMIGDSETDANAAKAAEIPVILLENGYTEKNTTEIYHNHLIKDFVGIEKIITKYL